MDLEKDKQGGSREEGKSERSQTAGCGEESGSSKRDGKCLGSLLQRTDVKAKTELHNR